jgi:hypothetical protein
MSPTLTFYYSCAFHSPTYRTSLCLFPVSYLFFFLHFLNFSLLLSNGIPEMTEEYVMIFIRSEKTYKEICHDS